MTADQHIRMIIGDVIVKSAVLLEQIDALQDRVKFLEENHKEEVKPEVPDA